MNPETLSIKTIIGELDFLINSYYSMKHWKKQVSQLFVTKLIEKIPDPRLFDKLRRLVVIALYIVKQEK